MTGERRDLAERAKLLEGSEWQMSFGERAALEGVASQLRPALAIEIGTAEGGSLTSLARHCEEIHSFDLAPPQIDLDEHPNVTVHTGDSHQLLPETLTEFAEQERNVELVLVDGDHSAAGVRKDIENLLASPAISETVILAHDTANGVVREGLEAVRYDAYPKVAYADLDFVPGFVLKKPPFANEMWGGLALILVNARRTAYVEGTAPYQDARYSSFELLSEGWRAYAERQEMLSKLEGLAAPDARTVNSLERELIRSQERLEACRSELRAQKAELEARKGELEAELEARQAEVEQVTASFQRTLSWRVTAPLRALNRRLARRRRSRRG